MRSANRARRHERGSGLVESALCLMLFVTLVYSVMEFGRMIYSYNVLAGATREAARYAIVHGGSSGSVATQEILATKVKNWAIGLDTSAIAVTATWENVSKSPGTSVLIVSQYTLSPFTRLITAGNVMLTTRSEMVISQ